ncbi:MAG TPA: hypothetical protein VN257_08695 [Actinotalea sp.]|nr:hypothetical protein [Actinotalea sp.]
MRSPSSLIFILLLGIWAAYFVQYWVRRRDHLATARSVDQFSAAMRVLERRDSAAPVGPTASAPAAPRAYAVHPRRPAGSPVVTERVAPERVAAPVRSARPQVRPSRRVRGITVLAAAAALLVSVPLALLAVVPGWVPGVAALLLGAALAWVRAGVRAQASLTRAHRRRQAELARLRASAPVTAPVVRRGRAAADSRTGATASARSVVATASVPVAAPVAPVAPEVAVVTPSAPFVDLAADLAAEAAPVASVPADDVMVPILDEDDMPLTWDPVPVPRPTYTMKAMAPRADVEPADVTPTPAPVDRHPESVAPQVDERRAAGA